MKTRDELAEIACEAMNAIGFCITALEQLKKGEKWSGTQDVALKAVQGVHQPFFKVYEHLSYRNKESDMHKETMKETLNNCIDGEIAAIGTMADLMNERAELRTKVAALERDLKIKALWEYKPKNDSDIEWSKDAKLLRIVNAARAVVAADIKSPPEISRRFDFAVLVAGLFEAVNAYNMALSTETRSA
jgi:hypothetical protein